MYIITQDTKIDGIFRGYAGEKEFDNQRLLPTGIKILYRDDLPAAIRNFGKLIAGQLPAVEATYAAEGMKSPVKLTPAEYIQETERLAGIAETCLQEGFDWPSVLPLTKAGKLPKERKIPVAISECVSIDANKSTIGYFSGDRLQLMLEPVWEDGWPVVNVAALVLTDGPISSKTPPIFNRENNMARPVTVRSKYLKDKDVLPGSVYLSGKTEFLFLGRITHPDDNRAVDQMTGRHYSDATYMYVRFTKDVKTAVKDCKTQVELYLAVNALADSKGKYMYELCNITKSPKKFTELVTTVTPPTALSADGQYEFFSREKGGVPRRTWFLAYDDPHVNDGRYFA